MNKYILKLLLFVSCIIWSVKANNKIVTIGTCSTEIVCALGNCLNIEGTDSSSLDIINRDIPNIGYWRAVNIESILSLKPSLVILSNKIGPKKITKLLKKAKIEVLTLNSPKSWLDLILNIKKTAIILDVKDKAKNLLSKLSNDLKIKSPEKFYQEPFVGLFSMGGGSWYMTGLESPSNFIIDQLGAFNVSKFEGAKIISLESILQLNPKGFLVSESSGNFLINKKSPFENFVNKSQNFKIIVKDKIMTETCISSIETYRRVALNAN
ncbi:MAG: hypothetical protein COB02_16225 [Candidatus Cloacimonadota bacterium]|nr:MAG: hypothetical protein COB02_16225 [Candidatus Cloacimonadota bacterium]